MIELRPFDKLGGADHGWLKAKHHFSFGSYHDPNNLGHGALRVWNDDEIAPNSGFPAASARQHGDHHLRARRRDHPSGQPRQRGPHRGRRRAGDERGLRHPSRRIQSGADARPRSSRSGSSRRSRAAQPTWGAKPFPKADRSGKFVTIASGFAGDDDALPIRADARVLGSDAEGRRNDRTMRLAKPATATSCRRRAASRSTACRINARDGAAIRGEASVRITALDDAELVFVDAA